MKTITWNDAQTQLTAKPVTYLWFGTDWCGDCQMMLPVVTAAAARFATNNQVQFLKVDAEEAGLFRQDSIYQVKRVPTHVFLRAGQVIKILYEYIPVERIVAEIEQLLAPNNA